MMDELLYTQEDIDEWIRACEELQERNRELEQDLAEINQKIEQGTLIELPCKVGDCIWVVCGTIFEYEITEFWYDGVFFMFKCTNAEYVQEHRDFSFFNERIGKTVFLTREEAEKRLKELQE